MNKHDRTYINYWHWPSLNCVIMKDFFFFPMLYLIIKQIQLLTFSFRKKNKTTLWFEHLGGSGVNSCNVEFSGDCR